MEASQERIISRTQAELDDQFQDLFASSSCNDGSPAKFKLKRLQAFFTANDSAFYVMVFLGSRLMCKAVLFVSGHTKDQAYLGCYDVRSDHDREKSAHRLLTEMRTWAQSQGIQKIYGPIDRNTWYSYRVRTDDDEQTFSWEPGRNSELLADWRKFGFAADRGYASYGYFLRLPVNMRVASLMVWTSALKARWRGFHVEPMSKSWRENLADIHQIALDAFAGTHLFEAIPFEEFQILYENLDETYDLRPSFFLRNTEGQRVGFILAYFEDGYIIFKSMGIAKAWHGWGLGRCLAYAAADAASKTNCQRAVAALFRLGSRTEVNAVMMQKLGILKWKHQYELLTYHINESP